MTNPTSNFGWQMPTSTDLVTDLPADFETFGQAVDTSLADLKGGTSGQILAKASNTDMDFTWVTNDVGDITAVTAGTGLTGGGTSGAVTLNVDPTYAGFTNLNYISNPILNSAFQIWQRGTSIACSTTAYTADRWQGYRSVAGGTISRQATGDTTNLPNIQYCARVQRDSGNTSTATIYLAQTLETVNSIPYAGKSVTFSFYARKGANLSSTGAVRVTLQQGAGTDQNVLTSMSSSTVVNIDASLTTTWQRFTGTGTVNTTTTQLGLYVDFNPTGTAGAADYLEITGVQIDIGSVALPFRTYAGTIQGELAACQRYYWRTTGQAANSNDLLPATMFSSTQITGVLRFPVPMRTAATCSFSAAGDFQFVWSAGTSTISSANIDRTSAESLNLRLTSTGLTTNGGGYVAIATGSTKWLEASAEL